MLNNPYALRDISDDDTTPTTGCRQEEKLS